MFSGGMKVTSGIKWVNKCDQYLNYYSKGKIVIKCSR